MAKKNEETVKLSDHLAGPLEAVISDARALRGRVVQAPQLELLISLLEGLRAAALHGCGMQTWHRKFTLKEVKTAKSTGRKK